jgi:bifunctional non-homologous end joining protein LigD
MISTVVPSRSTAPGKDWSMCMPLEEYRRKRRFSETPEPEGRTRRPSRRKAMFVVQKHLASRLHYDFRLEIGGVLVSWAVPKGPSMNPTEKRLAMRTEDHPMEYARFEGVIPEGHYGAGKVLVWDTGTWEPDADLPEAEQLKRGEIKFTLHGRKLRGSFVLVHTGKRATVKSRANQWLLIKHRDEFADSSWEIERPELDRSVLSRASLSGRARTRSGHAG